MFTFKVTPDQGEPYELVADSRDVLRWERAGRNRSVAKLRETMSFVDLYALAHGAATRQGLTTIALAEFEETCVFEMVGDEDEDERGDPTRPAP